MYQEDMFQKSKKGSVYNMNIKKQIFLRGLIGMAAGFFICYFITIMISLGIGTGEYYPVVPQAAEAFGTELNAVIVQTIISMLYGAVLGAASVIWELENWSLLKQTVVHFLLYSTVTFPVAYFLHWMPHNIVGILIYYGIFVTIYATIWLITFTKTKHMLKKINKKL